MILDDYQKRVDQLFHDIKTTQRENILAAGKMIADTLDAGGNIYLNDICHSIEMDLYNRGGGPFFYRTLHWAAISTSIWKARCLCAEGIQHPPGRCAVCGFRFGTDKARGRSCV